MKMKKVIKFIDFSHCTITQFDEPKDINGFTIQEGDICEIKVHLDSANKETETLKKVIISLQTEADIDTFFKDFEQGKLAIVGKINENQWHVS